MRPVPHGTRVLRRPESVRADVVHQNRHSFVHKLKVLLRKPQANEPVARVDAGWVGGDEEVPVRRETVGQRVERGDALATREPHGGHPEPFAARLALFHGGSEVLPRRRSALYLLGTPRPGGELRQFNSLYLVHARLPAETDLQYSLVPYLLRPRPHLPKPGVLSPRPY